MIGGVVSSVLCSWGWFGTAGEGSVGIGGLVSFVRSAVAVWSGEEVEVWSGEPVDSTIAVSGEVAE